MSRPLPPPPAEIVLRAHPTSFETGSPEHLAYEAGAARLFASYRRAKPERQQVNATVALTFDADAELSGRDLRRAILDELARMFAAEPLPGRAVLTGADVITVTEEAAICSNQEGPR